MNILGYLLFEIVFIKSNIIKVPLFKNYETYDMKIRHGSSPNMKSLELNMNAEFIFISFISLLKQDPEIKKQGEDMPMNINNQNVEARMVISNFYLNDHQRTKIKDIMWYYITDDSDLTDFDSFPLAYSCNNKEFSVIHSLYQNNLIEHQGFGILLDTVMENGTLFLGGFDKEIVSEQYEYKYLTQIDVEKNYSTWGLKLNSISFGKKKYIINKYAYFQSNKEKIIVPQNYLDYLIENDLSPYFLNKTCNITQNALSTSFICSCDVIEYFPVITFTLNNIEFPFYPRDLFEMKHKCFFLFASKENLDSETWIMGIPFMSKFFTFFDYEKDRITIYSKYPIGGSTNNITMYLFLFNIVMILFFLILIIISKLYKQL